MRGSFKVEDEQVRNVWDWLRSWFRGRERKAGAAVSITNQSGAVAYQYQPGLPPTSPADLVMAHERLTAMDVILTSESRRLQAINPASLPSNHPDLTRIRELTLNSCAESAARIAEVAINRTPAAAIDLSQPVARLSPRDMMYRINGDPPLTLPGTKHQLHIELAMLLQNPGDGAVLYINRSDGDASHACYAENILGNVWLFEGYDGVAVPLHQQPVGVVGISAFYDFDAVATTAAYDCIKR